MLNEALERARQGRAEAEADLFELLTIPSVSATPERRADCRRAAARGGGRLRGPGRAGQGAGRNAERLATDHLLVADGSFVAPGVPRVLTGLRGILYTEIEVTGPRVDLHSGIFGGVAPNPFNSLAHVLAGLKDRDGVVRVPGFYDDVEPPTQDERACWETLPIGEDDLRRLMGGRDLAGQPRHSIPEPRGGPPP